MQIDFAGRSARLVGERHVLLDAIGFALEQNGCAVQAAVETGSGSVPDILVISYESRMGTAAGAPLVDDGLTAAMMQRGAGRVVVLLSALAAMPARRFPAESIAAGAALLEVRLMAMRLGPAVLVNAVGCGAVAAPDDTLVSGDASMLSHVPTGLPGTLDDVVNAVLFLCDPANSYMTGQMLTVDGGWSAGYARNF